MGGIQAPLQQALDVAKLHLQSGDPFLAERVQPRVQSIQPGMDFGDVSVELLLAERRLIAHLEPPERPSRHALNGHVGQTANRRTVLSKSGAKSAGGSLSGVC